MRRCERGARSGGGKAGFQMARKMGWGVSQGRIEKVPDTWKT